MALILSTALTLFALTGCGSSNSGTVQAAAGSVKSGTDTSSDANNSGADATSESSEDSSGFSDFDTAKEIGVITREDGSGTGARS